MKKIIICILQVDSNQQIYNSDHSAITKNLQKYRALKNNFLKFFIFRFLKLFLYIKLKKEKQKEKTTQLKDFSESELRDCELQTAIHFLKISIRDNLKHNFFPIGNFHESYQKNSKNFKSLLKNTYRFRI